MKRAAAVACILAMVAPTVSMPSTARPVAAAGSSVMLVEPLRYQQMYISSCEAASVHIALHIMGVEVPEGALIAELPTDPRPPVYGYGGTVVRWGNPYRSFVGDIRRGDSWPMHGYGVYAAPIVQLLRRNGMTGSYGGSHLSLAELRRAIDMGRPVIVWVPKLSLYWYRPTFVRGYWTAWDGERVPWNRVEHAQVVVGYDATGFYLDNPDSARWSEGRWIWHYTTPEFVRGWNVLEDQAVIVTRDVAKTHPSTTAAPPTATPASTVRTRRTREAPATPTPVPVPSSTRVPARRRAPTTLAGAPRPQPASIIASPSATAMAMTPDFPAFPTGMPPNPSLRAIQRRRHATADYKRWHRPSDTIDKIDIGSLCSVHEFAWSVLLYLDESAPK